MPTAGKTASALGFVSAAVGSIPASEMGIYSGSESTINN